MASNFIPMLSSSPPPLDDCPDNDDDDEEFGNFTSAGIPFDSSFDSPVSGGKCKPFKAGENGVNDIGLKNELNSFHSFNDSSLPTGKNLVLSLSPQNQSNHKTGSPSGSENEEELILDESGKVSLSKQSSSPQKSCDQSLTSQKSPPESFNTHLSSAGKCPESCKEDIWVRQDAYNCSNEPEFSLDESELVESQIFNCNPSSDSTFLPCFVDELKTTEDSEPIHIPISDIDLERTVEDTPSSVEPVVNSVDRTESKINEIATDSEHFVANFPVEPDSSFDEFDDFQVATRLDSVAPNGNINNTCDGNSEQFVANFDNIQPVNDSFSNEDIQSSKKDSTPLSEDEFDDFQGFAKSDSPIFKRNVDGEWISEGNLESSKAEAPDQELEDFDDFQGCSGEDGFAEFGSEAFDRKLQSASPEFADFEKASFCSTSSENLVTSSCLPPLAGVPQEKSADKMSTVFQAIFPTFEESNDVDVCSDIPTEVLEQSNKSRRLWEKLHEVEQTPGLRFQWGVSHSFQQLLRSINVDYHSILRTSSVPIFASSLSLLEPVKGQTNSANPESEDRNQSPKDPIPPVEFDWNLSGLVNPLDSGQSVSTLMDLSFLSTSDSGSSTVTKDHSFENEFLKPSPIPACSDSGNKAFTLEELLSKNVCSIPNSNVTHRPTDLSEEANGVLDQLPDLSFMRAKVLMFPISSKT